MMLSLDPLPLLLSLMLLSRSLLFLFTPMSILFSCLILTLLSCPLFLGLSLVLHSFKLLLLFNPYPLFFFTSVMLSFLLLPYPLSLFLLVLNSDSFKFLVLGFLPQTLLFCVMMFTLNSKSLLFSFMFLS